jgi:hypothetical protein
MVKIRIRNQEDQASRLSLKPFNHYWLPEYNHGRTDAHQYYNNLPTLRQVNHQYSDTSHPKETKNSTTTWRASNLLIKLTAMSTTLRNNYIFVSTCQGQKEISHASREELK